MTKKVCIIEGDDAAPEAIRATVELLRVMELDLEFLHPLTGKSAIEQFGTGFPTEARDAVLEADTTLFGAASGSTPALGLLRQEKGTYANVRPIKYIQGALSSLKNPTGVDYIIVRENLEDAYIGVQGDVSELSATSFKDRRTNRLLSNLGMGQAKFSIKVITEEGTRRVVKFACELARKRLEQGGKGLVTITSKYNLLSVPDGLFRDIGKEVVNTYPDLEYETLIVDNFAQQMTMNPDRLDVVVMPNLYGDILSDAGAGTIGGLGMAPSGCYSDDFAYFEPIHGTAPDIAGMDLINPTATLLSAAMMLDYLNMSEESKRLTEAIEKTYQARTLLTSDQGGYATTTQFSNEIKRYL